jgi:electron transfer flavoprotein alpha subunit
VDFIVLLKQVPDISSIPADAWNHETGTLKRAMLDNVLNQFDLHALACACRLREHRNGRIICLTMGIRSAAEVLVEAMARGADTGILLNDPAFAGADTSATARTLALAIRKVEREMLAGSRDYLVIAGMQSTDGDTAQVPAQLAEALGIDSVAYVCGAEYDTPGIFSRIAASAMERVEVTGYPAVITLTDCTEPPYPTLERMRRVRLRPEPLTVWTAADLEADVSTVGAKGSWTQVVRIFSPLQEGRRCRLTADPEGIVPLIHDGLAGGASQKASDTGGPKARAAEYTGQVFVYAEIQDGSPAPVTLELVTQARMLADAMGEKVGVVLVGSGLGKVAQQLIECGADSIYLADNPRLQVYDSTAYAGAVADVVRRYQPQIMLFGATSLGRELAPRVAYATGSGLTADCTQLAIGDHAGKHGVLLQTRPALGGNIMATIISKGCRTQMATVRPGVFIAGSPDPRRKGAVIKHECPIRQGGVKVLSTGMPLARSELVGAQIIVSGGGGVRGQEAFARYLRPLAVALGERFSMTATVGASRRAVEHSYATRNMQVGQTGQTVSPVIYVAVGISGAVQHISAIQKSKLIIAINPDPKAAIFRTADIGFVGKAEVAIPRILDAMKAGTNGK